MARKKAQALPQPEPEMLTVYGDIVQETEDAILLVCDGEQHWLPKSQVEYTGERGDKNVAIALPDWLASEKGLSDGQGERAAETSPHAGVEAADAPQGSTEEEQGSEAEPVTPSTVMALRFKADVTAFEEDGYTLTVTHKETNRDFHLRKDDLRYESDDIVDLQVGYSGLEFLVTWDVAAETGLADFLGASMPAPATDAETAAPLVAETDRPDTSEAGEQPQARPYRHALRRETITATVQLTPLELNECARRITDALSDRNRFKDLASDYSSRARAAEKEAYKAAEVFESGEEERRIDCDVVADYNTGQLVFVERAAPYREVKRLPMTEKDRQLTLFDAAPAQANTIQEDAPSDSQEAQGTGAEQDRAAQAPDAASPEAPEERCCDTCAHDCDGEDGIAEEQDDACEACDENLCNWKSRHTPTAPRECSNCAHTYRTFAEGEDDPCRECSDEGRENWAGMDAGSVPGGVEQSAEQTAVVQ